MKLNKSININEAIEQIYNERKTGYSPLFEQVDDFEKHHESEIGFDDFFSICKSTDIFKHIITNPNVSNTAYALYCIYNWAKYRLVYDIKNSDRTISRFPNTIKCEIINKLFFNHFFILFDLSDKDYFGAFVSKDESKLYMCFVYLNKSYKTESLYVDLSDNKEVSDCIHLNEDDSLSSYLIKSDNRLLTCSKQIFQLIYAIYQGYNHEKTVKEICQNDNQVITKQHIKVRKSQIIEIEVENTPTVYVYPKTIFTKSNMTKAPHPRRGHVRKLKRVDKSGNSYTKEVWVKSTVIHKNQYISTTEKDVR